VEAFIESGGDGDRGKEPALPTVHDPIHHDQKYGFSGVSEAGHPQTLPYQIAVKPTPMIGVFC
jgi:hypothetical protein